MKATRHFLYSCLVLMTSICVNAQNNNVDQNLKDIDVTINKILKDWNVPGCGVGIVVKNKLVFAKGYGYRGQRDSWLRLQPLILVSMLDIRQLLFQPPLYLVGDDLAPTYNSLPGSYEVYGLHTLGNMIFPDATP